MNNAAPEAALCRTGTGLALVSAGVTAWQIVLMQALGWVGWYHFAYLVIALALLGFGASGTVLTLARERLVRSSAHVARTAAALSAAGMALVPALLGRGAAAPDVYLLFVDARQAAMLAGTCAALAVPFFLSGFAIGVVLTGGAARAGRLYAWNLAGSGAGGVAGWLLLSVLQSSEALTVVALLPLCGAFFFRPERGTRAIVSAGPATFAAIAVVAALLMPGGLRPSQFKDISRLLDIPGASVALDEPHPRGRLQIMDAPVFRPVPPTSLRFTGEIPVQRAVLIDGNLRGSLLSDYAAAGALAPFDHALESVA